MDEDYETCCHFLRHEKKNLIVVPTILCGKHEMIRWILYNNETIYFGAHNGNPSAWNHVDFLGV